jgi:hypothetical protein
MQFPNALAIILADSSIQSLFWPLYFAWKSAWSGIIGLRFHSCFPDRCEIFTSNARSRKSRRIENKAGNVHPRFSTKKRKKKLEGVDQLSLRLESLFKIYKPPTHETNCDCSLNASPGRRFAACVHTKTYWIAISSHGLWMHPSK